MLQLAPKRLQRWCCSALLRSLDPVCFVILQGCLRAVVHIVVGSFAVIDMQRAPKRLQLWYCGALLRSLGPARFEILQGCLLGVGHLVVGSFAVIPFPYKGCTDPQGIPRLL